MGCAVIAAYFFGGADANEALSRKNMIDPSPGPSLNLINFVGVVHAQESYSVTPDIEQIIRFNFGDLGDKVVQQALKVAACESGLRPEAVNTKNKDKSRDDGTYQINSIHGVAPKFLHNPRVNIAVARQLYDEQGWGPWYSSRSCHHLK